MTNRTPDRFKTPNVFWSGIEKLGLTPVTVLRQAGLPVTLYDGAKNLVTTAQFFSLWRAIAKLSADPAVGLKIATQLDVGLLAPSDMAAFHARDYRDALTRMARFKQLCTGEEMRVTEGKIGCTIELTWVHATDEPPPLLIDAAFASFVELGRRGTQTAIQPLRVELTQAREPTGVHAAYFACPIKFRAPHNVLILRPTDLDRVFVTHNAELLEMLQPQLGSALAKLRAEGSTREQVKWLIKRILAGTRPDIAGVAKELGVSRRTLQRRITDEGTSFRELVLEARQDLMRQYLVETSIDIAEAAYLLGYKDPNSFYRAFREWEGTTPARWRSVQRRPPTARKSTARPG